MIRTRLLSCSCLLLWATACQAAFVTQRCSFLRQAEEVSPKDGNLGGQQLLGYATTTSTTLASSPTPIDVVDKNYPTLDVVLFGVGDLRTDDHVGLARALSRQKESNDATIAALCVLDADSLRNVPGMVAHTVDTVQLLVTALQDLAEDLQANYNLPLAIVIPQAETTVHKVLDKAFASSPVSSVKVHVHDLGEADNQMGYAPFAQLSSLVSQSGEANSIPASIQLEPWTCQLRQDPWDQVSIIPDTFTDYRRTYLSKAPESPVTVKKKAIQVQSFSSTALGCTMDGVVQVDTLLNHVVDLLHLDEKQVVAEANSGLYMTHWGGLTSQTVGGRSALDILRAYTGPGVQSDDDVWRSHPLYPGKSVRRNKRSLEHASMEWQLRGKDGKGQTPQWLAGEAMIRWASAPLMLGTLSPRRIWQVAHDESMAPRFFFDPPLQTLVETREWHKLLASHNILTDPMYQPDAKTPTTYRYWRYQGFLCRYAFTDMEQSSSSVESSNAKGIVLVHGFGASGAQWNKTMQALSKEGIFRTGLAPDLLGFGHAEKPAISYTAYLWDAIVCDFIKEQAIAKYDWDSYVIGGNSIGGFTAMSAASSESAVVSHTDGESVTVTSSGAPGTGKCQGLVLMNSAGPILSEPEVQDMLENASSLQERASIAQITATDALPPCSPPNRPLARIFGNGLLTYLRPNIQSICKRLYPTNPAAVGDDLCQGILRDSLDPGAVNVMMAGAKLPVPRASNEILRSDFRLGKDTQDETVLESVFEGPVLVSQGVLDPLNDSTDRMNRFAALRKGITTYPIQAGHCPHDEQPYEVAQSISQWATKTLATPQVTLTASAK